MWRERELNQWWLMLVVVCLLLLAFPTPRTVATDVPFSRPILIDGSFDGAASVYAADIDGDGDLDLLGAARDSGDFMWWENMNGAGTVWTGHVVDADGQRATSTRPADLDGDGDLDVLGHSTEGEYPYDGYVIWWENTNALGTDWNEHIVDSDFDYVVTVRAADIDDDGDTDVLAGTYSYDDNIAWWENTNGLGTAWIKHLVNSTLDAVEDLDTADVDGDGNLDIIGASFYKDDVTWWENTTGAGTSWIQHTVDANVHGACGLYATDMDGDNDIDIVGTSYNDNYISWWENTNGSGTAWAEHTVSDYFEGASSAFAVDLDADGDLDVLATAFWSHDIAWWENADGNGTAWLMHLLDGNFGGASDAHAADIDGDGDVDVLGAARINNDITLWKNLLLDPLPCGDFGGDLFVNLSDFCVLAREWFKEGDSLQTDLIDDDKIDELDLDAFCQQWLTPCP